MRRRKLTEARVREPMVPLHLFANRCFSVANVASGLLGFAMLGTLFFLVQFLQNVQGDTALEAGLRCLPASLGIFAVGPFVGQITTRIGPRLPIVLGALITATSLFLLVTTIQPAVSYVVLWWQVALFGIGCGLMLTPLTAAVLSATPPQRSGLGSSILNTCRTVGITLGIVVLGVFVLQQFPGNITSQLTARGLSATVSAAIAQKVAAAGAGASQVQTRHLPLNPLILHQAISQAFVDTLHTMFLIPAIGLLVAALLVALFLRQPASEPSVEAASLREGIEVLVVQSVGEEQVTG